MSPEHRIQILEFAVAEWNSRIRRGIGLALMRRARRCAEVTRLSKTGLRQYQEEAGDSARAPDDLINVWESHKQYLRQEGDVQPELSVADKYFEALYHYDQAVAETERNGHHHASIARMERLGAELMNVSVDVDGLEGGRWPMDSQQYRDGLVRFHARKLVVVVKELHRLVVGKALEVVRLDHGHVGTKQSQKISEGLRRTNRNINRQLDKINEMARQRPELERFANTTFAAAAKPDGIFWTGYAEWLTGQGRRILHPRELVAVRHVLYIKRAEEELEILKAEVLRARKWAHDRVGALETCIRHAGERLASPGDFNLASLEMIRGQLAVLNGLLSEATAQLQDLESRFPQGSISINETIHVDADVDIEEEVDATSEDESFGLELREFRGDEEEEEV
jgi:hypothetical protein